MKFHKPLIVNRFDVIDKKKIDLLGRFNTQIYLNDKNG